jgi:dTDP-4-amino-4,6-dideoxygalactose transaminase
VSETVPFTDLGAATREVREAVSDAWRDLLDAGSFIGGKAVDAFERAWAAYCGTSAAIGVGNGTDAIQLALTALGIGPGDEVIVPANTFIASAEAVVSAGATPRFADVDPGTLLLTPETLRAAITPATRAVLVVHLYGQLPDMDALEQAAAEAGLVIVEDAAQAHGATWRGRRAGSMGRAGCFSFYPGKNLGAFGDAGAVVTSDEALAERIRSLRDHGRAAGAHHRHELIGINSRLDAVQAAVLTAKLAKLDAWTQVRRSIAARYRDAFADGPVRLVDEVPSARGAYHLAVVRVRDRETARQQLASMGIQTGIHYPVPCHHQPPYRKFAAAPLPAAEEAAGEILSLPIFPHMTDAQFTQVCQAVHRACGVSQPQVA